MSNYAITCDCGEEVKGTDQRQVEAEMWHHAIRDHSAMVKEMSVDQITGLMKGWDQKFATQKG